MRILSVPCYNDTQNCVYFAYKFFGFFTCQIRQAHQTQPQTPANHHKPAPAQPHLERAPAQASTPLPHPQQPWSVALDLYNAQTYSINTSQRFENTLLNPEEERELAIRYIEDGDEEAGRTLITSNLRLVVKMAFKFHNQWANVLDLIQQGNMGLLQALNKYDPYNEANTRVFKLRSVLDSKLYLHLH